MPPNSEQYTFANLISDIRYGKLFRSYHIALKTVEIIEEIIDSEQWKTAQDLINIIKGQIKVISETLPMAIIPTNVIRHVLKLIREIYAIDSKPEKQQQAQKINDLQQSLHHLVTSHSTDNLSNYSETISSLRSSLKDHLAEYKFELETAAANIAEQAAEHIDLNEIILTIGKSNLVLRFLKYAAKTRKFQVIVVESPIVKQGQSMATELSNHKIQTIVIPDNAVFAIMSRVNKVIIGVHSIMANGGLKAASGVQSIALAAKECAVPVMVLSHLYKLTPQYVCSYEQEVTCASPSSVLPYNSGPVLNDVHVYNPVFDYVPPELVTLFITHQGGNATSYVYRLLSELYHPDDYEL